MKFRHCHNLLATQMYSIPRRTPWTLMMQHHVSFCNAVIMVVLRYVSVKLFTALGRGTVPPLTVITSNLRKMRPLV